MTEEQEKQERLKAAKELSDSALLFYLQNHYEEAEPLFQEVLSIYQQYIGEKYIEYANTLHNLALLYSKQRQIEKAEPLFEQAKIILKAATRNQFFINNQRRH
jgi:tetratricopeptide (TPR) repeat protein